MFCACHGIWTLAGKMMSFLFPNTFLCWVRVSGNTFQYVFGQTSIRASVLDPSIIPLQHRNILFAYLLSGYATMTGMLCFDPRWEMRHYYGCPYGCKTRLDLLTEDVLNGFYCRSIYWSV